MADSFAHTLRHRPTPAERAMWRLLFPLRTGGYHFRKQVPIGPYVVDLACHHAKLAIEIDGETHGAALSCAYDAARSQFLHLQGYMVLRFSNAEVLRNAEGVYLSVLGALRNRPKNRRSGHPLPNPPHRGEGEDGAPPRLGDVLPLGEAD